MANRIANAMPFAHGKRLANKHGPLHSTPTTYSSMHIGNPGAPADLARLAERDGAEDACR